MAELNKLRPDRDLQCYYEQPSAIAAMSEVGETGFTVSGCWRQQFDWAVLEWNRDNVIEHPALRNLPDGDLSGLQLSYEEVRTNCAPMDSKTFDSVGWSYLRVWEESGGSENFHQIPLINYSAPVAGSYTQATAVFELGGTATAGDYIELAWLDQHANAIVGASLSAAVEELAGFINGLAAGGVTAVVSGTTITLTYTGAVGANGNRVGVYGGVYGANTESWSPAWSLFSGGVSPTRWLVDLDFSNLVDTESQTVDMSNVRRLRWTWAAELQWAPYERTEFSVVVSDWDVTGTGRQYMVAGPGSRRIEDNDPAITYSGSWSEERGNYSGGSIHHTQRTDDWLEVTYQAGVSHTLYLGTRCVDAGGEVTVQVDSGAPLTIPLLKPLEDYLHRVALGTFAGGTAHTVRVTHSGADWTDVFFDFLEIAIPSAALPTFGEYPSTTLATDWDTYHSLAIAPERTAWLIDKLGFKGRANHYVGALWFYELVRPDNVYAQATITFAGAPSFGGSTQIVLAGTTISHLNYITDTATTIAKAFELLITAGASAVWAEAAGPVLTIHARAMGTQGNAITVSAATFSGTFTATVSGTTLAGGVDGDWLTDLTAVPRLNRAARDWHKSYFEAMDAYGIPVTAAFSMELKDGDDSLAAGIAQRYPSGPVWLNTPALQTNFGPESTAFWKQVYRDMADVMVAAGIAPYLQFGEVQWWFFADASGMPFYDDYTTSTFEAAYSRPLALIASEDVDPALHPEEAAFLPTLIGDFTQAVMSFVRATHPTAQFEVLYPPDTNDSAFGQVMNFPADDWTPASLACLKTENFTYTGNRNLNQARGSLAIPGINAFPPSQSSHLVGIGDYTTPWLRELDLALAEGVESAVLFALDQFCLIGYGLPLKRGARRAQFLGR